MITFPPQMRDGSPDAMVYRHIAGQQSKILRDQLALGKLNMGTRRVTLNNGVEITCTYCYGKEDIWVKIPPVVVGTIEVETVETINVLIHPRQGEVKLFSYYTWESGIAGIYAVPHKEIYGVAGGWSDGKTALVGEYIYPMIDEDNASYELTGTNAEDEEITGGFAGSSGNYGNLYWYNGDDESPVFLSWKGTPTRHFRLPNNVEINGFTVQETAIPSTTEDMPIFTSFGTKIYQDGDVLFTAPRWNWPYTGSDRCLVLGAMQDGDGTTWAMMQSDRYNVPRYIIYFSDGYRIASDNEGDKSSYLSSHSGVTVLLEKESPTKLGIFTMLWKQGGPVDDWTFVAEWNTGRQGLPWFGNKSGTEFVNPLGTKITTAAVKTDAAFKPSGSYKEEMAGGNDDSFCSHGKFTAAYTAKDFYEFKFNDLVYGNRSLLFDANTLKTVVDARTKVYEGSFTLLYDPDDPDQVPVPLYWDLNQYTTDQIVNGQPVFSGAKGGQGVVTETYSGFAVDENGIAVYQAPCSETNSAMGSITVTDACGASITREVRLSAVGVWVTVGWTYFGCTGIRLPSTPCDSIVCGGHYALDTTCKFRFTTPYGYASNTETSGYTRRSAFWGCFSSVGGGYVYPTTSPTDYFGNRGSAPSPPEGISCAEGSLVPVYQQEDNWVCP